MLKVPASSARLKVTAIYGEEGSVLKGTLQAFCENVKIDLEIESDQDPEDIQRLVELAWNGCWTVQALLQEVSVDYELSIHNSS